MHNFLFNFLYGRAYSTLLTYHFYLSSFHDFTPIRTYKGPRSSISKKSLFPQFHFKNLNSTFAIFFVQNQLNLIQINIDGFQTSYLVIKKYFESLLVKSFPKLLSFPLLSSFSLFNSIFTLFIFS